MCINNILVTIVTPSFNQGKFIEETILSVLNQTYKNIEYIIVDGESTDNTMEIIQKYRDKVDIIIHEKDKGQSDAINKGFKLAKGELVGWINSDDILFPDCVEKIVEKYNKNKNAVIFCNSRNYILNEEGEILKEYSLIIRNKNDLLFENYSIIQQGSFYLLKAVNDCEYLDENLHYCMDLDLWLKLLHYGNISQITGKPTAAFRIYNTTKTSTGGDKFLIEIRQTLLKYGASYFSKTVLQTYWYQFKYILKLWIEKII